MNVLKLCLKVYKEVIAHQPIPPGGKVLTSQIYRRIYLPAEFQNGENII